MLPSNATLLPPAAKAFTLNSIALENIGPFESLKLDLTPSWNLLLGDNGKGKTVILRSIAAALCGEYADPAVVTRLLRSESKRGIIRLTVENRDYTVELERDDSGTVQVKSQSLSPIQSDYWLTLGFPALRSVPWENPAGPSEVATKKPNAEDLLPMLRGIPDGRVANLKQWIVNLDYAGRRHVIDGFLKTLGNLTQGVHLEFKDVNKDTMEILVKTNGSVIPLSAVSQGTGSVMCWIGTLIQRLSETGIGESGRALVLIDEIDAHMHPKWQQLFIDAFRKQFPSVQVIATTHSPLLVESLKENEICLVREAPLKSEIYGVARVIRQIDGSVEVVVTGPEPDGKEGTPVKREDRRYRVPAGVELRIQDGEIVETHEALTAADVRITAERLNIPPSGWRVDQILTLPYFGLATTRDSKTAELIDEFTRLLAMSEPSKSDRDRLEEVAAQLRIRTPEPNETEAARQAAQLINDFAAQRLARLTPEEREKILAEVKVQMTESISGSRRPV
jgi:hypothetical protein